MLDVVSLVVGASIGVLVLLLVEAVIVHQLWKAFCAPGKLLTAPPSDAVHLPDVRLLFIRVTKLT
jgi:hypothetical protein